MSSHIEKTQAQRILEERESSVGPSGDLPDFRDLRDGGVLWKASLVRQTENIVV